MYVIGQIISAYCNFNNSFFYKKNNKLKLDFYCKICTYFKRI